MNAGERILAGFPEGKASRREPLRWNRISRYLHPLNSDSRQREPEGAMRIAAAATGRGTMEARAGKSISMSPPPPRSGGGERARACAVSFRRFRLAFAFVSDRYTMRYRLRKFPHLAASTETVHSAMIQPAELP